MEWDMRKRRDSDNIGTASQTSIQSFTGSECFTMLLFKFVM